MSNILRKAQQGLFSNPNLIINGDMGVWQRGNEHFSTTGQYTADRFICGVNGGNLDVVEGFGYGAGGQTNGLVLRGTNAVGARWNQRVEANNFRSVPEQDFVTLSFWAFSTTAVSLQWSPRSPENVDDWNSVTSHGDFTIGTLAANTWTKVSHTIPVTDAFTNGFGGNVELMGTYTGDATFSCIKLEFGEVATPFIADDPATNLAKCQRYAYVIEQTTGSLASIYGLAVNHSSTHRHIQVPFPVTMRALPTVEAIDITMSVAGRTVTHLRSPNGVRTQVADQGTTGTAYLRTATYSAEL